MFRAMFSSSIRSTWLYLQYLVVFTQIAAGVSWMSFNSFMNTKEVSVTLTHHHHHHLSTHISSWTVQVKVHEDPIPVDLQDTQVLPNSFWSPQVMVSTWMILKSQQWERISLHPCHISLPILSVDCVWNVMAHALKPVFVFRPKGRVHLNRRDASVQSTTGMRAVHINLQGLYCSCKPVFCSHVTLTGYQLHSLVSPSLLYPCVTVCHHISNAVHWATSPTMPVTSKRRTP
jgi:hypothetical protein